MTELTPRDKQAIVQSVWTSWNSGNCNLELFPKAIKSLIETGAWRDREVEGRQMTNSTFREFVISAPLKGCGWANQIDAIEKILGLKAPDVLRRWREAITPPEGKAGHTNNNVISKTLQGNSKGYTLSRLSRDHPELYGRVIAGELSANAAAIEAGFRKKPVKHCPKCHHEW